VDSHGGRVEIRTLETTNRLRGYLDWPGVAQVCRVEMTVRTATETTHEVGYAITSVPPEQADAAVLLQWWRGHWKIENRLHYVRDMAWDEDRNRTRIGSGPQVLAAFRNAAVTLLRSEGITNITAALRHNAARVRELLVRLRIFTK